MKYIFETYIETGSLSAVYNFLKNNKIKNRDQKVFTKQAIFNLLRYYIYTGKIKHLDKFYQGIHKPIISNEIFNMAQNIHQKRVKKYKLYKHHTFGGTVHCTSCGYAMTSCFTNKKTKGKRKLKRYFYYRCTSTLKKDWNSCDVRQVNADKLKDFIVGSLERISKDDSYLENLVLRLNHNEKEAKKQGNRPDSVGFIIPKTENGYSVENVKTTIQQALEYIKARHRVADKQPIIIKNTIEQNSPTLKDQNTNYIFNYRNNS